MKFKVETQTGQILKVMKILAWIAFFGFVFQIGSYLFTYVSSCFNPESAGNFWQKLDLYELSQYNFTYYTVLVIFLLIMSVLKATIWFMVVKLLSRIKMKNPFTMEVAHNLESISYSLFIIWIMALMGSAFAGWLGEMAKDVHETWNSGEFLFMTGLTFIISQIFKRGVELQSENELTV